MEQYNIENREISFLEVIKNQLIIGPFLQYKSKIFGELINSLQHLLIPGTKLSF